MLIVNGTVHCLIMNIGCLFGLRRLLALVELYHRFPTEKKKKRKKNLLMVLTPMVSSNICVII